MCAAVGSSDPGADPAAGGGGVRGGALPHREVLPDEPPRWETNRLALTANIMQFK